MTAAAAAVRPWNAPSTATTLRRPVCAKCEAQRVLVRLGAAVDEEDLLEAFRREADERLGGPLRAPDWHRVRLEVKLPGLVRRTPRAAADGRSPGAPRRGRRRSRPTLGRPGSRARRLRRAPARWEAGCRPAGDSALRARRQMVPLRYLFRPMDWRSSLPLPPQNQPRPAAASPAVASKAVDPVEPLHAAAGRPLDQVVDRHGERRSLRRAQATPMRARFVPTTSMSARRLHSNGDERRRGIEARQFAGDLRRK